jgi:hypothetical protein
MTEANYVELVLDAYDGGGNQVVRGQAAFTPSMTLVDAPDQMWIPPAPQTAVFGSYGPPKVKLLAPDSPGPQPAGWTWGIAFTGVPGSPAGYSIAPFAGPVAFTATDATPCVFTFTPVSGGLSSLPNGTGVQLSGGSLPAGFSASVTYYVAGASGYTFQLAATTGGSPIASTSTGSGELTVAQYNLSALSPAGSGQSWQAYLPLPSGTPSAGQVPVASGSGDGSAWETLSAVLGFTVLQPSGDESGTADGNAIDSAISAYGHVILAPGQWYVGAVGLTTGNRWLQGSGQATVVNAVSGATGFLVVGATQLCISDMQFVLGSGSKAIGVTGASDYHGWNLEITGSTAAGGIYIDGDDALEQHWTDVVMRDVGGKAFDYERTTTTYTGSLYLDRVRITEPPAGAYGFWFNSTAGSPSLNTCFMNECVADDFGEHALYINNCAQIFVEGANWFAVSSSAAAGSAPVYITGGAYGVNISGGYLYNGLASGGFDVIVAGGSYSITIGGGITFDGDSATTCLGLSGAGPGIYLGTYQQAILDADYNSLTDTPAALSQLAQMHLGDTNGGGEETQPRWTVNANLSLTSGLLALSYFRAKKTEYVTFIETATGSAASGGTYAGMGLFTVSPAGLLTLVAKGEQASSPALWSSAYEYIGGASSINTRIALSANYLKRAGVLYAVGLLWAGSGSAPQISSTLLTNGAGGLAVAGTPLDQLSAQLSGQSTLGTIGTTTHTQAALSSCGYQPYCVLET